jgi:homogentisate 1,2-dioxygenase
MPIYHQLGKIPAKRHTQFRKANGELFHEELFGTIGFEGMSSLLYHTHPPTQIRSIAPPIDVSPVIAVNKNITPRKLLGFDLPPQEDFLAARVPLMVNSDIHIGLAAPTKSTTDYFYKNADADELLFIHHGKGKLSTLFGQISFVPGDYLIIPRGVIYQIEFETTETRLLLPSHSIQFIPQNDIAIGLDN